MSEQKRTLLTLTSEAVDALGKLTSPRKQGEFVSKLILDSLAGKTPAQPGILERIESKLDKLISSGSVR